RRRACRPRSLRESRPAPDSASSSSSSASMPRGPRRSRTGGHELSESPAHVPTSFRRPSWAHDPSRTAAFEKTGGYRSASLPAPSVRTLLWGSVMLKITPASPEDSNTVRWLVEGRVAGAAGTQLERAIAGFTPEAPPVLDCAGVTFIDRDGARAVVALVGAGVTVVRCSPFVDEMLRAAERDADGDD